MPNNVTNWVRFEGDPTEIQALVDQARSKDSAFDFEKFVPMPEGTFRGNLGREEESKYPGEKNWYGWCNQYWGTKWNAYSVEAVSVDGCEFDTAWNCPRPFFIALSKLYPNVRIMVDWIEEMQESAGYFVVQDGAVLQDFGSSSDIYVTSQNMKLRPRQWERYLQELEAEEAV